MAVKCGSGLGEHEEEQRRTGANRAFGHSPGRYGRANGQKQPEGRVVPRPGLVVEARLRSKPVSAVYGLGRQQSFTASGICGTSGYQLPGDALIEFVFGDRLNRRILLADRG